MKCIIVNDDVSVINRIKLLIQEVDSLNLIESFNNTYQASKFIIENTIDLIFFDLQIDDENYHNFIKSIPQKTFIIFVYGHSSITINDYQLDKKINRKLKRFKEAVNEARIYYKNKEVKSLATQDNYFLI